VRTTVSLDDDTAAAVQRLRREHDLGVSEAVNQLIRRGLRPPASRPPYVHRTRALGLRSDVTDVGAVLDLLDEGV
jgi:Arc/MetJ family transcription regulator